MTYAWSGTRLEWDSHKKYHKHLITLRLELVYLKYDFSEKIQMFCMDIEKQKLFSHYMLTLKQRTRGNFS